jgi:two-component system sensor histidine kinase RegB
MYFKWRICDNVLAPAEAQKGVGMLHWKRPALAIGGAARRPGVAQGQGGMRARVAALEQDTEWCDTLQAFKLLALYRCVTPAFQAAAVFVTHHYFLMQVATPQVIFLIGVEVVVAAVTLLLLRLNTELSPSDLQLQALLDIALFSAMLYFTGGSTNPFAPLYVLPLMLVSMALSTARLCFTTVATMVCYLLVYKFHVPLRHPYGQDELYRLHHDGEFITYMATSWVLVFFAARLFGSLREHARQLRDAQEARMRSEAVAAIGALAASSAHQLGSPLGTMAVLVAELRHRYPDDPELAQDVVLFEAQLASCSEILAQMASAGDDRRAVSASRAPVDAFIESIVQRVRATHPEATLLMQLEGPQPAPLVVIEESLKQTVLNVLHNAVRFSSPHVSLQAVWTPVHLEVSVSDRGPGFSPQALQVLGRRVVGHEPRPSGMGMGLLLGAETLQRMGGSLALHNRPDGGACVQMQVPLASILIHETEVPTDA